MTNRLLLGLGRWMIPIPGVIWQRYVSRAARTQARLGFMSEEHHRVHDCVVLELPRAEEPLSPEIIADALDLSRDRATAILDELEQHMTFLFRNTAGEVEWAYPVTVDSTPHHVTFSSGEQVNAA